MTDRAALLMDLADRVEKASGPDRELDFAIFRALHPEYAGPEWKEFGGGLRHAMDSSDMRCLPPPNVTPSRWTASLEAALSLVPEGWAWAVYGGAREEIVATAYRVPNGGRLPWPDWVTDICAATPALALCAAALRALASGASR